MPLINVKLIENVFTPDQKREIIERVTDAMVSIEGENMRPVTWVVVEEVTSGGLGHRRQAAEHRGREGAGGGSPRLASPAPAAYGARARRRRQARHRKRA